jgi:hypothetical protein
MKKKEPELEFLSLDSYRIFDNSRPKYARHKNFYGYYAYRPLITLPDYIFGSLSVLIKIEAFKERHKTLVEKLNNLL